MKTYVEAVGSEAAAIRTWCVVYDVETKEVVHTHEYLALDADGSPNEEELARAALAAVPSASDKTRLAVAHPASGVELAPDLEYTIDPKSAALMARPAGKREHAPPS